MGLTRLTLVAPLEYPAPEATWRAASAVDVMENARVVDTLDEAIADCQFVVGTECAERRIPWPVQDARRCAERIVQHADAERVAILLAAKIAGY